MLYEREVLAGELVIIRTVPIRAGRTSVTYLHRMQNVETDTLHATCENVTVLFDLNKREAVPLTPEMRALSQGDQES